MRTGLRRAGLVSKSFFYAVVVHIVVGVLLLFNMDWPTRVVSSPSSEPAPVQANVVSEAEIQKQKEAIRKKEQAKERKQQEAQEKLEELLAAQKAEQERLAEIKQRQKEEAERAEELAQKKEQEAQELAKLKQKEEEERKKAEAEAEKKRQAEAERKRQEEEERKRREAEEQRRKEEQRQKELAEERERQRQLQEQLERERVQQRVDSALAQYIPIIKQKVSRNWNRPAGLGSSIEAHVTVRLSQAGEVLSARIVRSSGNPVFDRSVENAVLKASPLPIPQERGVNEEFRSIKLIFKPEEMIS